jgi:hypothetical protein
MIPTTRPGRGTTFVTAFRARRGRERLRRDREARRASGSRLGGSRAAHDVATHTSDQISARIPPPREGSQYATQRRAPRASAGAQTGVEPPSYCCVRSCGAGTRRSPDARDPALEDPGCRPASPEAPGLAEVHRGDEPAPLASLSPELAEQTTTASHRYPASFAIQATPHPALIPHEVVGTPAGTRESPQGQARKTLLGANPRLYSLSPQVPRPACHTGGRGS